MKAFGMAAIVFFASAGGAGAVDLGGWTQPLAANPLCELQVTRVYQTSSGQPIHIVMSSLTRARLRFDLDVILDNGRTGETRQILSAELKPGETKADFATSTGYSTTGKAVRLRLNACTLN